MAGQRIVFTRMEEVVVGVPAAQAIADLARRLEAQRVFVMSSGALQRQTGEVGAIRDALGTRFVGLFDRIPAHSPRGAVVEAARLAGELRTDLIVSVGGGTVTDAAKAVRLCLANGVRDVEDFGVLQKDCKPATVRQVAVPTTLSAAEFSAIAGVTNEATRTKELLRDPAMIPVAVVLDAAITLHTPDWLFLSTGIRAVDHCVEGFCANESHALAQSQSLHGLRLLASGLARVKADPADQAARLDCLQGAWLSMGAVATGVPMGASHGIGYVLGAAFGVPHGHTSCVMLPAVLRWNLSVNGARQALLAAAMGAPGEDAATVLERLIGDLGLPRRLAEVGVGREHMPRIAQLAMATPWVPCNPRRIAGPADVQEILALAA